MAFQSNSKDEAADDASTDVPLRQAAEPARQEAAAIGDGLGARDDSPLAEMVAAIEKEPPLESAPPIVVDRSDRVAEPDMRLIDMIAAAAADDWAADNFDFIRLTSLSHISVEDIFGDLSDSDGEVKQGARDDGPPPLAIRSQRITPYDAPIVPPPLPDPGPPRRRPVGLFVVAPAHPPVPPPLSPASAHYHRPIEIGEVPPAQMASLTRSLAVLKGKRRDLKGVIPQRLPQDWIEDCDLSEAAYPGVLTTLQMYNRYIDEYQDLADAFKQINSEIESISKELAREESAGDEIPDNPEYIATLTAKRSQLYSQRGSVQGQQHLVSEKIWAQTDMLLEMYLDPEVGKQHRGFIRALKQAIENAMIININMSIWVQLAKAIRVTGPLQRSIQWWTEERTPSPPSGHHKSRESSDLSAEDDSGIRGAAAQAAFSEDGRKRHEYEFKSSPPPSSPESTESTESPESPESADSDNPQHSRRSSESGSPTIKMLHPDFAGEMFFPHCAIWANRNKVIAKLIEGQGKKQLGLLELVYSVLLWCEQNPDTIYQEADLCYAVIQLSTLGVHWTNNDSRQRIYRALPLLGKLCQLQHDGPPSAATTENSQSKHRIGASGLSIFVARAIAGIPLLTIGDMSSARDIGQFHHSTIAGNKLFQTIGGEIAIHAGNPYLMTNRSGHFQFGADAIAYLLNLMKQAGIDVDDILIQICNKDRTSFLTSGRILLEDFATHEEPRRMIFVRDPATSGVMAPGKVMKAILQANTTQEADAPAKTIRDIFKGEIYIMNKVDDIPVAAAPPRKEMPAPAAGAPMPAAGAPMPAAAAPVSAEDVDTGAHHYSIAEEKAAAAPTRPRPRALSDVAEEERTEDDDAAKVYDIVHTPKSYSR